MMVVFLCVAIPLLIAVAVVVARAARVDQPPRRHTDPTGTRARRGADLW